VADARAGRGLHGNARAALDLVARTVDANDRIAGGLLRRGLWQGLRKIGLQRGARHFPAVDHRIDSRFDFISRRLGAGRPVIGFLRHGRFGKEPVRFLPSVVPIESSSRSG
jgi:hypothetical protein